MDPDRRRVLEIGVLQLVVGLVLVGMIFAVAVRDSSDRYTARAGGGPAHQGPLRARLQQIPLLRRALQVGQSPQKPAAKGPTNA